MTFFVLADFFYLLCLCNNIKYTSMNTYRVFNIYVGTFLIKKCLMNFYNKILLNILLKSITVLRTWNKFKKYQMKTLKIDHFWFVSSNFSFSVVKTKSSCLSTSTLR